MWWSLALGGDLGGNLTAVGSSANIVMIGIALESGNPISFWQFTRKGVLVTAMSTVLCALYLWLRYFVLAWWSAGQQCDALDVMGQRERVEHRELVHRVAVTLIQPDVAGE